MKKQESNLSRASNEAMNSASEKQETDWKEVLFEVIIKILTLGFYHIKKHKP